MKKVLLSVLTLVAGLSAQAQIKESFDLIPMPANTYKSATVPASKVFENPNLVITSSYDTIYDYWDGGFAISNMRDSSTSGFGNLYSCKGLKGLMGSPNYLVGQNNSEIIIKKESYGNYTNRIKGVYLNNSTYAYNSMRDGDQFAKKFGGVSGNDPDFFLLTVNGMVGNSLMTDSVNFYLADYRDSNNVNDYIVKEWKYVDLSALANADKLIFKLRSSDVGSFGINTPAFFCLDHLILQEYEPVNWGFSDTFDDILSAPDTFKNNFNDTVFYSQNEYRFNTGYNTSWDYWSDGWAVSTMKDTLTPGYTNLYSAISGPRANSIAYGVGQNNATINTSLGAKGFYINNGAYAYYSMLNGDQFGKKFGGATGNDPDFFKLVITGNSPLMIPVIPDSVEVYLADYRFDNNEQDYILKEWTWVDLSKLGLFNNNSGHLNAQIRFKFVSSDTGANGINTPLFFCADGFVGADFPASVRTLKTAGLNELSVYPNPSNGWVNIKITSELEKLEVLNLAGAIVMQAYQLQTLDLSNLAAGTYILKATTADGISTARIVKQ